MDLRGTLPRASDVFFAYSFDLNAVGLLSKGEPCPLPIKRNNNWALVFPRVQNMSPHQFLHPQNLLLL